MREPNHQIPRGTPKPPRRALDALGWLWAPWVALWVACTHGAAPAPPEAPPVEAVAPQALPRAAVHYQLHLLPGRKRVDVHLSLREPGAEPILQAPHAWGGDRGLGAGLVGLRAWCQGAEVTLEAEGQGRLRALHPGCPLLELSYRVDLGRPQGAVGPGAHRLDPARLLIYGQTALIVPERATGGASIEVVAPASWEVVSTWHRAGASRPQPGAQRWWPFVAEEPGHLLDAALVAGSLKLHQGSLPDGRSLEVALDGALPMDAAEVARLVERLVAQQRRFLPEGWRWPAGTGRMTVIALPRGSGQRAEGAGRRGGVVLELPPELSGLELAELLAHETFHTLNGHLLVHEPADEYASLWFKEGITTYLAILTVTRAGLADEGWARARLGSLVQNYYENPLAMSLDHEGLARRFWSDPAARRLPYDKGALLGLILDARLGKRQGRWGVERWLARLLAWSADEGQAYNADRLLASLGEVGLERPEVFWGRFVAGVEPVPLAGALESLGLELRRGHEQAAYYGLELGRDQGGSFVLSVDPQGPAARAGLRPGDRLAGHPRLPEQGSVVLTLQGGRGVVRVTVQPEAGRRATYRLAPCELPLPFEALVTPPGDEPL